MSVVFVLGKSQQLQFSPLEVDVTSENDALNP